MFTMMGSVFKRRKIAGAIGDIRKKLQEATDRHGRYTVDGIAAKPAVASMIDPRLAAMFKDVTQLIGIDKSSSELLSMMMMSHQGDDTSNSKMKIVSNVELEDWARLPLLKQCMISLNHNSVVELLFRLGEILT